MTDVFKSEKAKSILKGETSEMNLVGLLIYLVLFFEKPLLKIGFFNKSKVIKHTYFVICNLDYPKASKMTYLHT